MPCGKVLSIVVNVVMWVANIDLNDDIPVILLQSAFKQNHWFHSSIYNERLPAHNKFVGVNGSLNFSKTVQFQALSFCS